MIEIRNLSDLPKKFRNSVVSIGNFDGVHLGHAAIIQRLLEKAAELACPALIFSFDPHPVRLLRPEQAPPPLTWTRRKAQLCGQLGVNAFVAYPTDKALLSLTPDDFFQQIIKDQLGARALVEGENFYFGKGRAGNVDALRALCQRNGIDFDVVPPLNMNEQMVSSSRIRATLAEGNTELAAQLLGRPYSLRGMVTHGAQRGKSLGFPTANLDAIDTLIPAAGVYAGCANWNGKRWPAAINIGPNPTFAENRDKVEIHLLDFDQTIYGEALEVDFRCRLRDIRRFSNATELVDQLKRDVDSVRELGC